MQRTNSRGVQPNVNPGRSVQIAAHEIWSAERLNYYRSLYLAAQRGDWETAKSFIEHDSNALTATITAISEETVLHVAAFCSQWEFVLKLLELTSPESIVMQSLSGKTVLHHAALGGSLKTVKALVQKNNVLLQIGDDNGDLPLLYATWSGNKELVWYLSLITRVDSPTSPFFIPSLPGRMNRNMTYEELVSIMHTVVKYDVNKHSVDLQSISIIPGTACRMLLRNDDDVQFMLGEDREIPQVCVSLTERATRDVIGNDIPPGENTQQFGSASSSNQVFTQKSATEGRANMCVVPPVVVDHADIVEPQFGDVFGCRIEMNDGQYNKQYNEMYNNMYNEQNTKPNLGRNEKVDNKTNIDPLDHLEIIDEVSV
ncbi:hypothetical protein Dsin_014170 [Dipteronia sinensis]|uniref:Uncharacterized protein n=1 Tax=Dipteronia sinensis TaxID=43782 RepID=A0AAE0AMD2_9ROSI|nr:hypothetical protein Dsin_014170 [Dipteronia sinensis]